MSGPDTRTTRPRAVLCEDDATVRSVIGKLVTDAGYEVVAEADGEEIALHLIERTGADLVVLDLALSVGSGEHFLATVHDRYPQAKVIVFSAYVGDPLRLLDAGAHAVVEKPDFLRLEEVLDRVVHEPHPSMYRRDPPRPLATIPPPAAVSISGFESWVSFVEAAAMLAPGDAVLVLDVIPPTDDGWDRVFLQDYRCALGRAAVSTQRTQDRVSMSPSGLVVMLVVAGHPEAPAAVFDRIEQLWRREIAAGTPVAAFDHIDEGDPGDQVRAAIRAVETDGIDPSHPLRML